MYTFAELVCSFVIVCIHTKLRNYCTVIAEITTGVIFCALMLSVDLVSVHFPRFGFESELCRSRRKRIPEFRNWLI